MDLESGLSCFCRAASAFFASCSRCLICFFVSLTSLPARRMASSFAIRCSSRRSSNALLRPVTCLLILSECVLHVKLLVHDLSMFSVRAPQCLSGSYCRSLHGSSFSFSRFDEDEDEEADFLDLVPAAGGVKRAAVREDSGVLVLLLTPETFNLTELAADLRSEMPADASGGEVRQSCCWAEIVTSGSAQSEDEV